MVSVMVCVNPRWLDLSIVWLSKTFQNIGVRLNVWVAPVAGEGVPVVWKVRRISWHTVRNLGGDKVKVEVELQVYVEAKVEEEELCEYQLTIIEWYM